MKKRTCWVQCLSVFFKNMLCKRREKHPLHTCCSDALPDSQWDLMCLWGSCPSSLFAVCLMGPARIHVPSLSQQIYSCQCHSLRTRFLNNVACFCVGFFLFVEHMGSDTVSSQSDRCCFWGLSWCQTEWLTLLRSGSSKDDQMASHSQCIFTFPTDVKNVSVNNGGLFCLWAVFLVLADQNGAPTLKRPRWHLQHIQQQR